MYSTGNIVNDIMINCVVTVGDHTCHGESFIMDRIVESLCCLPETHRTLCVHSTSSET